MQPNPRLPSVRKTASVLVSAITLLVAALAAASWSGALKGREDLFFVVFNGARDAHLIDAADIASDAALMGLVVVAAVGLLAFWKRHRPAAHRLMVGIAAAGGAYGLSELLKIANKQPRPCHELPGLGALRCPPLDDWSLPSNHATIAVALATALIITARAAWIVAIPLASSVVLARIASGEHYPHDVIDGALLGTVTVLTAVAAQTVLRNSRRLPK